MEEKLIEFLIELNDKGLINNHDFDYEKEAKNFANKDENKQLIIYNVVGSLPTRYEKNNLPENVRYAFCEAIEMYQQIQSYELGIINKDEFSKTMIEIKNKYK